MGGGLDCSPRQAGRRLATQVRRASRRIPPTENGRLNDRRRAKSKYRPGAFQMLPSQEKCVQEGQTAGHTHRGNDGRRPTKDPSPRHPPRVSCALPVWMGFPTSPAAPSGPAVDVADSHPEISINWACGLDKNMILYGCIERGLGDRDWGLEGRRRADGGRRRGEGTAVFGVLFSVFSKERTTAC